MKVKIFYKRVILFAAYVFTFTGLYPQKIAGDVFKELDKAVSFETKAEVCFIISRKYADGLKVDSALYFAEKIKEFSQKVGYKSGLGLHYLAVGGALRLRNRLKESEDNIKRAIDIFNEENSFSYLGLAYQQLASVNVLAENFILSRKHYRQAIRFSNLIGDENALGRQYYEMGRSFYQTFDVDSAAFYFTKALEYAEKLDNISWIFNTSGSLGSLFLLMNDPEKSIHYIYYALHNQPPKVSQVMLRIRLMDLAESHMLMSNFAKADSALKAVERLNQALKDPWGQAVLSKLKGVYELGMKNYPQALFYLRSAYYNGSGLENFEPDIKNIAYKLGLAEYETGLYDSAIVHLKESMKLARKLQFLRDEMSGCLLVSKSFEKKRMADSALFYLVRYDMLKDSLFILQKEKAIIEISAKYETEKKEQAIKILQQEGQANELLLQLKNQQIQKQFLEDERKSQQLELISQQNEINKLDAAQKALNLDNEKKENEKNQAQLTLLEQDAVYQKLLTAKQKDQKRVVFISIGLILTFAGYMFYRYIRRKKMQNQQELLNERLRISRELHDELGATLTGISMYSHLTRQQIKSARDEDVEKSLNKIQESTRDMISKLSDIVWLVNPEKDSLLKLIERIEQYAEEMSMIKGMEVKISVSPKLANVNLPVENRRSIYLFCKEAINNAVKYSHASQLEISMRESENKKIEIRISDNGKGFDSSLAKGGNGLINMKQRAADIGGEYSLDTSPGLGTKIALNLKIT